MLNADCTFTAVFTPGSNAADAFHPQGHAYVLEAGGITVSVRQEELTATESSSGKGITWMLPSAPRVTGNTVRFSNNGLDWVYEVDGTGLKLSAAVDASRGPATYEFPFALLGEATDLIAGDDGSLMSDAFRIPRAFAIGANGELYDGGAWQLLGNRLAFQFDDSNLPPQAYPYVLDPTTTFEANYDGHVAKTGPTYPPLGTGTKSTTTVDTSATTISAMRTKRDPCLPELTCPEYEIRNALVRWDTSSIPDDAVVTGATARLRVSLISDSDSRNLTADWNTWWPIGADDYSETAQSSALAGVPLSSISFGQQDFSLSGAAANISKTGSTGLRFHVSGSQPTGENELQFRSVEHATGPAPALLVTYSTPPTISAVTDTPDPVTADDLLRFDVAWSDADPGDQVRAVICKTNQIDANWTCPGGAWVYGPLSTTSPSSTAFRPTASDHGTKTYYAFACDQAAACSTSVTGSFTVQNRTPTISSVTDSPDPVTAGTAITFSLSWSDAGDSVKAVICKTDALVGGACSGGTWATGSLRSTSPSTATYSPTAANAGSNNYYAFVCDAAGACSGSTAGTFTVKNPSITSASDSPDPVSSGDPITFSVGWSDSDAGDSVKAVICKTDQVSAGSCPGGSWATGALSATSPSTASFTPTAANQGTKTYYAFACDQAGACSTSVSGTFTVDNRTPTIGAVTDSPDPVSEGSPITFNVSWTDPGDSVKAIICKTDQEDAGTCPGGSWASGSLSNTSPASAAFTPVVGDIGVQNYYAFACDAAGECSTSATGTFTVQKRPPTLSSPADAPDPVIAGRIVNFTLTWTHDEPVRAVVCKTNALFDGSCAGGVWAVGEFTQNSPSKAAYETTAADIGTRTYYAFACDGANLCSASRSGTFSVQSYQPPGQDPAGPEIVAERSRYGIVYQNPDGTKTLRISAKPIHYQDGSGTWQRIDTRIVPTADPQHPWRPAATDADIRFPGAVGTPGGEGSPDGGSSSPAVELSLGTSGIAMAPRGARSSIGVPDGSTITYPEVYTGVDWALTVHGTGLKEALILKAPPAPGDPVRFDFDVQLNGLEPQAGADGDFLLVDGAGNTVLVIPAAWMEEAPPPSLPGGLGDPEAPTAEAAHSHAVAMTFLDVGGQTVLRVEPDSNWLRDPQRRYPVVIDPTSFYDRVAKDTYIDTHDLGDHHTLPKVHVGSPNGTARRRGLVKYGGLSISRSPGGQYSQIQYAEIALKQTQCSAQRWVVVKPITVGWGDAVHWNNQPPTGGEIASNLMGCSGDVWKRFTSEALRQHVQNWVLNTAENHGFMIFANDEWDTQSHKRFSAMEDVGDWATTGSWLTVHYNFPPDPVANLSPVNGYVSVQNPPTLRASFEDGDGNDRGWVDFEIYRTSDNVQVAAARIGELPNHAVASWTVPNGSLRPGVSYRWQARGYDGIASGPWSTSRTLIPWTIPSLNSVADSPDPVDPGQQITFTANWTDPDEGDSVRALICRTASLSSANCAGGAWATGSLSTGGASTAQYVPSESDLGVRQYYAFVCDSRSYCAGPQPGTFSVGRPPDLISASVDPAPAMAAELLTFAAEWNDPGDSVRLIVCKTNQLSGGSCPGGEWATGSMTSSSPAFAQYQSVPQDVGVKAYFPFVCDSRGLCSSGLEKTFEVEETLPAEAAPTRYSDAPHRLEAALADEEAEERRVSEAQQAFANHLATTPVSPRNYVVSFTEPVSAGDLFSSPALLAIDVERLALWMHVQGTLIPDVGEVAPESLGWPVPNGPGASDVLTTRALAYLDERISGLEDLRSEPSEEPDPSFMAALDRQLGETRALRAQVASEGVEIFGLKCTCSPQSLVLFDQITQGVELRAVEERDFQAGVLPIWPKNPWRDEVISSGGMHGL